jgi:hypothetical protein
VAHHSTRGMHSLIEPLSNAVEHSVRRARVLNIVLEFVFNVPGSHEECATRRTSEMWVGVPLKETNSGLVTDGSASQRTPERHKLRLNAEDDRSQRTAVVHLQ